MAVRELKDGRWICYYHLERKQKVNISAKRSWIKYGRDFGLIKMLLEWMIIEIKGIKIILKMSDNQIQFLEVPNERAFQRILSIK